MNTYCAMKSKQRGITMVGVLFVAAVLLIVAMLALKLVPAYVDYFTVQKILSAMGGDSSTGSKSNAELRDDFARRAKIDNIKVVTPEDLVIDRSGGVPVISVDYEFQAPLVANVRLVVDFSASSDSGAAPAQVE
jgi:hypothetical protein